MTEMAVNEVANVSTQVEESILDHEDGALRLETVARKWVESMIALGVETKGLWLVDFDNGSGYYCWCHPESSLQYFHTYDEGFAGRMRIQ